MANAEWGNVPCIKCGGITRIPNAGDKNPVFTCMHCGFVNGGVKENDAEPEKTEILSKEEPPVGENAVSDDEIAAMLEKADSAVPENKVAVAPMTVPPAKNDPFADSAVICPECSSTLIIPESRKYKLLVLCDTCRTIFIRPGVWDPKKSKAPGAGEPPTPKQLRLLDLFGIKGEPCDMAHASEILTTVSKIVEQKIHTHYISYMYIHQDLRFDALVKMLRSDLFIRMYFDDDPMKKEDFEEIIQELAPDVEVRFALSLPIAEDEFKSAATFISQYSHYMHGLLLDPVDIYTLALKTFTRGYGIKLRSYESVMEKNDPMNPKTPKRGKPARRRKPRPGELYRFYTERTKQTHQLDALLMEAGYLKPGEHSGCFGSITMFALTGAGLALWSLFR